MGHAGHHEHFLERLKRVDNEQVDFAMSLYYNPNFVRLILSRSDLADGDDRAALALENDPDGPHIVVSRDGGFVTCLGRGMTPHGLYVISRRRIDTILEMIDDYQNLLDNLDNELPPMSWVETIQHKCMALNRQDMTRLKALHPILADKAILSVRKYELHLQIERRKLAIRLGRDIRSLTPGQEQAVKRYWKDFFLMHLYSIQVALSTPHHAPLLGEELFVEAHGDLPLWTWREGMLGPCLRAAWCAAKMGPQIADYLLERMRRSESAIELHSGAASLLTIALRHPQYYRPVRRLFRGWGARIPSYVDKEKLALYKFYQALSSIALPVLEEPEELEHFFLANGRAWYDHMLKKDNESPDELLGPAEELAPLDVLGFQSALITDVRNQGLFQRNIFCGLPVVARADICDIFPHKHLVAGSPGWEPRDGIRLFQAHAAIRAKREPVRTEEEPGRNDPCRCDSGRKYKHCCLRKN